MEIDQIRRLIRRGRFAVVDHAITEGLKDGITVADMLQAIRNGKIIERYPKRSRCLVSGLSASGLPVHVVIDFSAKSDHMRLAQSPPGAQAPGSSNEGD